MTVELTIPGQPKGKGRPRFSKYSRAYTPKATADYEKMVRVLYKAKYGTQSFSEDVPLSMEVYAYFGIPKRDSKAKKALKASGEVLPTLKPDTDNIIKLLADALNGYAYPDDKQITDIVAHKRYSDHYPRVEVIIREK